MLIYQAYGNTSQVVINGNTENSQYVGTIFAPDAYCKLNGTSEVTSQDIQVICDTIGITGTSDLDIDFNKTTKYVPPMAVDLVH